MNIQVTSRHFHGSAELQDKMKDMVEKLERFNSSMTGVHVILDAEKKNVRKAEVIINVSEKRVCVSAEADNMHKAVEGAFLKAEKVLKKENQKMKKHRGQSIAELITE